MLTQETIDKFYKDVESLKIKKKGAVITKATGFPKSNVSEYLRRIKTPSENFITAFYEHFDDFLPKSSINVTPEEKPDTTYVVPQISNELAELNTVLPLGDLVVTLNDYIELLKEKSRMAEESKREAEKRERTLLMLLENNLTEIKANSITIRDHLRQVGRMVRADDLEMMDSLDRLEGREAGTASTEAGKIEHALGVPDEDIDTNVAIHKEGNEGKAKQKGKA